VEVFGYPVQIGKIQPPMLPEETLRRDRLIDWLHAKTRSRLALVVADPGYGKTTLLADWSRRTRVRTLWYRLDEHDRDWAVFIHHIVAAGREIDPEFAPNTAGLLRELAANLDNRGAIVRTLLAELRAWAVVGTALVLDDYQQVDDVPEIREIVRELVVRGPDRLAVVIASRTRPTLPLARLRAIGEAAEIGTDDLRFDRDETERLFRDTYHDPLERDLLDDLARTTEGWAATLRLVESVVHGRPRDEVRTVIRSLSGRHGDLHDYLAEEVVGRMPRAAQDFVERSSLLAIVTPELASAAAEVTPDAARGFLDAAESAGLLSRRGRTGQAGRLFHPLVQTFLEGRLHDAVGALAVRQIHARIARAAEPASWSVAAYHFAAADLADDAVRVLSAAVPIILGSGAYKDAEQLASHLHPATLGAWHDVIVASGRLRAGDPAGAATAAARAIDRVVGGGDRSIPVAIAMGSMMNASYGLGDLRGALLWAERVSAEEPSSDHSELADALTSLVSTTVDADLGGAIHAYGNLATRFERRGYWHYQGISLLNAAWMLRARGDVQATRDAAAGAVDALSRSSAGTEISSAQTLLAWAFAHDGDWVAAEAKLAESVEAAAPGTRFESLVESAEIVGAYDDPVRASQMLREADLLGAPNASLESFQQRLTGEQLSRLGRPTEAIEALSAIAADCATGYPAFHVQRLLAQLNAHVLAFGTVDPALLSALETLARRQGTQSALLETSLLRGLSATPDEASAIVSAIGLHDRALLSIRAEAVLRRIADLSDEAIDVVRAEAESRPRRWRMPIRILVAAPGGRERWQAARLLEVIGTKEDVRLLRLASKESRGQLRHPDFGKSLARRVADPVYVDDLGRLVIWVGSLEIPGTTIRRKALALLCFLVAQPKMSATRDQVLDALWPDQDPEQAANSLHQTVYFLRRVFEPEYVEDLSPGYLHHDPDVLWLDSDLVTSRSHQYRRIAASIGALATPAQAERVSEIYSGRFALDFTYEEWAAPIRDSMHARYLEIVERAVTHDADTGQIDRAMRLAQRAIEIDPQLDEVEKTVIRLYTLVGAYAAAAEQYGHYSLGQRDLGLDPPHLEDLLG
jgi:ATP/maltotriose-dependent transcriptional regulator MalT/DNA-binding SARP family transcriptional activator